jgi:hypothetical protein
MRKKGRGKKVGLAEGERYLPLEVATAVNVK